MEHISIDFMEMGEQSLEFPPHIQIKNLHFFIINSLVIIILKFYLDLVAEPNFALIVFH